MKLKLWLLFLASWACALASNILTYNPASPTVANRVTGYYTSQDTGKWLATPNILINPTMPPSVPFTDLKVSGGVVVELTAQEKSDIAAALLVAQEAAAIAAAKAAFDAELANSKLLRAIVAVIADQINTLRTNPTTTYSAVTAAQIRTAIRNKLDAP